PPPAPDPPPPPPQELPSGGEVALLPRQHAQLPLQPAGARRVARGLGESQPAAVPRLGAAPLSLRERHVSQPLGRRGRPRLIELRFGQGERALKMTRARRVLAERETHVA